jgi:hypothetical protein
MGIESKFYVLPDASGYRPDAGKVAELINALRAARFLCDPKSPGFAETAHQAEPASSGADYDGFYWSTCRNRLAGSLGALELFLNQHAWSDVLLRWPNQDLRLSGLKYPFSTVPGEDGVYYDIEMHLAAETVYCTSEIIDPFAEIHCSCGATVEEFEPSDDDPFYSSRLPNHCPECQAPMNYAVLPTTMRDPWTGAESSLAGGAVYRFALVLDCGKCWPEKETVVSAEFLGVVERTLQIKTRVCRDFY